MARNSDAQVLTVCWPQRVTGNARTNTVAALREIRQARTATPRGRDADHIHPRRHPSSVNEFRNQRARADERRGCANQRPQLEQQRMVEQSMVEQPMVERRTMDQRMARR